MYQQAVFDSEDSALRADLIRRFPLALVHASNNDEVLSTPLPLVLEVLQDGTEILHGHISRHNPQLKLMQASQRASISFQGEQAYISSAWLQDRRYAPTWNYEFLQCQVALQFDESPPGVYAALRRLLVQMDANEAQAWQIEESPRLAMLAQHIVAFQAKIIRSRLVLKLGQGDTPEVIADTLQGLRRHGQNAMAARMERRLASEPVAAPI